jgi:two-component system, OmpR family, phosphate regulon sensor histidine kinase PhoR
MRIASFVRYDYATLDAYQSVHLARESGCLDRGIVVTENNEPIGVLSSEDLVRKRHLIVIDCLSEKPKTDISDKIGMVLPLMEKSGHTVLPVYDKEVFVGIVSQKDMLHHLSTKMKHQQVMLQSVAHDLKNPIASIKKLAELLQDNLQLSENKELVAFLNKSCDFAGKIIEDILFTEQSIEEPLVLKEEHFDDLIEECVSSFSKDLEEKQIVLSKELGFQQMIKLDRTKFKRAVYNLLSNSIKFTPRKGKINLLTTLWGDQLKFIIKDYGIGIPKKLQGQIFDKFTRAKRTGTDGEPTTGLGMYLTKQIVELHGGSISLESDGKTGTSFCIFLNLN